MKIVQPDVEILTPLDGDWILKHIERCGRICYKSEPKEESTKDFIKKRIAQGHESILEHFSFSVKFTCDRGVSHEIVRHRLASYSQESTRYCNYSQDKFGNEITVIEPSWFVDMGQESRWRKACQDAEEWYFELLNYGCTPQEARSVLPNSLKTELIMTANLREWRHFFKLRCAPAAHPDMRKLACRLLALVREQIPVIFDDIKGEQ